MLEEAVTETVENFYERGEYEELHAEILRLFMTDVPMNREEWAQLGTDGIKAKIVEEVKAFYNRKEQQLASELMAQLERFATLQVIDDKWKEHLREMDDLKEGIHLRSYGQKDPLIEYKQEGYKMFMQMLVLIRDGILEMVLKLYPQVEEQSPQQGVRRMMPNRQPNPRRMVATKQEYHSTAMTPSGYNGDGMPPPPPNAPKVPVKVGPKIGRNDPCPCGSGKKYKNCHGAGL
jgi:preprotein translocase subunit SecA